MDNPTRLVQLEGLKIATPCPASWADMTGDDRTRYCQQCQLHVHDLSAMTRAEGEALVASSTGRLCTRMTRRPDGTIVTLDDQRSTRTPTPHRWRALAASLLGALSTLWLSACGRPVEPSHPEPDNPPPDVTHLQGMIAPGPEPLLGEAVMGDIEVPTDDAPQDTPAADR